MFFCTFSGMYRLHSHRQVSTCLHTSYFLHPHDFGLAVLLVCFQRRGPLSVRVYGREVLTSDVNVSIDVICPILI